MPDALQNRIVNEAETGQPVGGVIHLVVGQLFVTERVDRSRLFQSGRPMDWVGDHLAH